MRFLATTILCLLALAASGEATVASAKLPPPEDLVLAYSRSGGLAATRQSLLIEGGTFAVAESTRTRGGTRRKEFHLGDRRIRSLQRGLQSADLGSIHGRDGGCADCYVYSIEYEGTYLKLVETEVPPRLGRVFDQLDAVITAHTVPPNARSAQD